MDKLYERLNFVNDSEPALNADNMNRMDKAIDDIDNRIIENVPFKLGIDADGNYGYYKDGADTVTPFKSGGGYEGGTGEITMTYGLCHVNSLDNNSYLFNNTTSASEVIE